MVFHTIVSACHNYLNLTKFQHYQICRWALKSCETDKISLRTCVFAYTKLHSRSTFYRSAVNLDALSYFQPTNPKHLAIDTDIRNRVQKEITSQTD